MHRIKASSQVHNLVSTGLDVCKPLISGEQQASQQLTLNKCLEWRYFDFRCPLKRLCLPSWKTVIILCQWPYNMYSWWLNYSLFRTWKGISSNVWLSSNIQLNLFCKTTKLAQGKWTFKRGFNCIFEDKQMIQMTGVETNNVMFLLMSGLWWRFAISSGWPLNRGSNITSKWSTLSIKTSVGVLII